MPRPWFQFHLSTCVTMMFVTGGLMHASTTPEPILEIDGKLLASQLGWPFPCVVAGDLDALHCFESKMHMIPTESFNYRLLAVDIVFAIQVVALFALLSELWTSRKPGDTVCDGGSL